MFLARRYRGRPWPGRTLVVVARDDVCAATRALWGPHLSGPWSLVRLPGDHEAVLHEPYVSAVAEVLAVALADVDGAHVPEPRSPAA
jgi:thioesterase domain-containing protein